MKRVTIAMPRALIAVSGAKGRWRLLEALRHRHQAWSRGGPSWPWRWLESSRVEEDPV